MSDIRQAEDAFLDGRAIFLGWLEEFVMNWYKPMLAMQMGLLMGNLPDEVLQQLDTFAPGAVEIVQESLKKR